MSTRFAIRLDHLTRRAARKVPSRAPRISEGFKRLCALTVRECVLRLPVSVIEREREGGGERERTLKRRQSSRASGREGKKGER